MRLNAAQRGFLIAVACMLLAFLIYSQFLSKKNYYVADNPTENVYHLFINQGSQQILGPGQSLQIPLQKGNNTIKILDKNNQLLKDTAIVVSKQRGMINVAQQPYYIYRQYYGYNINKDSLLLSQDVILIDGKKYFGGAKEFKGFYTEDFYYNVDEDFDKVIKNIDKVESRTKIFRKEDFLNYYNQVYQF